MNFVNPIWELKTRCNCCDGNGELCFSTCPECNNVVLICAEVGTVYPNPKNLTQSIFGASLEPSFLCPHCGKSEVSDFRDSNSDEIQQLGFTPDEYQ
jgi:hypothetical protein